jgi:hypothetical protein
MASSKANGEKAVRKPAKKRLRRNNQYQRNVMKISKANRKAKIMGMAEISSKNRNNMAYRKMA